MNLLTERWSETWNSATLCHRVTRHSIPSLVLSFVMLVVIAVMSRFCPVHPMLMGLALLAPLCVQVVSSFRVSSVLAGSGRELLLTSPTSTVGWLDGAMLWSSLRVAGILPVALLAPVGLRGAWLLVGLLTILAAAWAQALLLAHFAGLDRASCNYALLNTMIFTWPFLVCPFIPAAGLVLGLAFGLGLGTMLLLHLVRWHLELWRTVEPPLAILGIVTIIPSLYLYALATVLILV